MKTIFFLTCEGKTATLSASLVPLYTWIPLYILFQSTASTTGPVLPRSSYASSAALFATRHGGSCLVRGHRCQRHENFYLLLRIRSLTLERRFKPHIRVDSIKGVNRRPIRLLCAVRCAQKNKKRGEPDYANGLLSKGCVPPKCHQLIDLGVI